MWLNRKEIKLNITFNVGINRKMQSYSPPALSLSNQSSLPVLLQRKLLTFSLTYELGNTHTVVTHEPVIS